MAERHRSRDGSRDTERLGVDEAGPAPDQGGREGSRVARRVASADERKRATERPAGNTRVTKGIEDEDTAARKAGEGEDR